MVSCFLALLTEKFSTGFSTALLFAFSFMLAFLGEVCYTVPHKKKETNYRSIKDYKKTGFFCGLELCLDCLGYPQAGRRHRMQDKGMKIEGIPAAPKKPELIRVAAYARVSADKDAAFHSLESQTDYYVEYVASQP